MVNGHAGDLHVRAALHVVRVTGCLGHGQHRGEANVGALHFRAPLGSRAGAEHVAQTLLQVRPVRLVVLAGELGVVGQAGAIQPFAASSLLNARSSAGRSR